MLLPRFERYGGRRAVVTTVLAPWRIALGGNWQFCLPPDQPVQRLVFVCAGNICRSPYGEYAARRRALPAISMGLEASTGTPPNPRAAEVARARGIDLAPHRSRLADAALIRSTDLVLGFELWHVKALAALAAPSGAQVRLLGPFAGLAHAHVHDPYGLSTSCFERCFDIIDAAVARLAPRVLPDRGVS